jgi:hypothetical protein
MQENASSLRNVVRGGGTILSFIFFANAVLRGVLAMTSLSFLVVQKLFIPFARTVLDTPSGLMRRNC